MAAASRFPPRPFLFSAAPGYHDQPPRPVCGGKANAACSIDLSAFSATVDDVPARTLHFVQDLHVKPGYAAALATGAPRIPLDTFRVTDLSFAGLQRQGSEVT